jgi:glucose/arabinose dehydrogenase
VKSLSVALAVFALSTPLAAPQTLNDSRLKWSVWSTGFNSNPTCFCWIGPGEMLVFEKHNGVVRWVKNGVILGNALDVPVNVDQERGGLGIAADPDFANNQFVYVFYSKSSTGIDTNVTADWVDNRIERYTWNGSTLGNVFGPILSIPKDAAQQNGPNHDGGYIRIGPDGKLWGQLGDLRRGAINSGLERVEQNTAASGSSGASGIFRINLDGSIPSDNPFFGESDPALRRWWAYGIRNAFGFDFDPVTGDLWATENAPGDYDEVNRVPKGMNGGWLKIMGPDSRNSTYFENGNTNWSPTDLVYLQNAFYVDPVLSFKSANAPTALTFIKSHLFPYDLVNQCLFADFRNKSLYLCALNEERDAFVLTGGLADLVVDSTAERQLIECGTNWGTVTDMKWGVDGYLYLVDHSNGGQRVLRIRPVTDEVDPFWRFEAGAGVAGGTENAEASDDVTFSVVNRGPPNKPVKMGCQFTLNSATLTSMVLQVETHAGGSAVTQTIEAWNVATGVFDLLDTDTIGSTDVAKSFPLSAASYLDPTSLLVRVRIVATGPAGPSLPTAQALHVDCVRLDVTYP